MPLSRNIGVVAREVLAFGRSTYPGIVALHVTNYIIFQRLVLPIQRRRNVTSVCLYP
jgi:hypothetical protein